MENYYLIGIMMILQASLMASVWGIIELIKQKERNKKMEKPDYSNPNSLLSWFLMASYAYYRLGDPIMIDEEFDELALALQQNWDSVDHPHKHLVTESHLSGATGYDIDFPMIVKYSTIELLKSV
jgi:hypothetical protein